MGRTSIWLFMTAMLAFIATGCGLSATAKKESGVSSPVPESPVVIRPTPASQSTSAIPTNKSTGDLEKPPIPLEQVPPETASGKVELPPAETKPLPSSVPTPSAVITPLPSDVQVLKKGPNHFIITVAEKTPAHPSFGKGHHLGFMLDNVPGKSVVLKRGESYEFDVQTDPLHDVYFSTSPQGWGGGTVTEGIKGQFTYRGLILVTPNENTPEVIYYQCRNHSSMGGKVVVVNKTASAGDINRLLAANPVGGAEVGSASSQKNINDAAKQKIMLAELMFQSKSAKAVADNGTEAAKNALSSANAKLKIARQELVGGNASHALTLADEALKLIAVVTKSSSNEEAIKVQRDRYSEAIDTLKNFQDSHKQSFERTVKKRGVAAAVDYDHAKVDGLVSDARALNDKGQHEKATQLLIKAERLVTQAIQAMLNAQTIVYDLNFESPADEYEYERKRFVSYEELIPIAIEEKKPAEPVVKLMDTYVAKGRARKVEAEGKAKAGNYPEAISLMLAATEEIQRALRLAGVSQ